MGIQCTLINSTGVNKEEKKNLDLQMVKQIQTDL